MSSSDTWYIGHISIIININNYYFDGYTVLGLIESGVIIKYHANGKIMMTGQYSDNWKIGIWTTYYENGKIESLNIFIKGADEPVIEKEFDINGEIIYSKNEKKEIEEIIENTTR